MSDFDLAVSFNQGALDKGLAGLYANHDARTQIFQGEQSITSPFAVTARWDVLQAPTVTIGPTDAVTWSHSIDKNGKHPAAPTPPDLTPVENPPLPIPTVNAFVLNFAQFHAEIQAQGGSVKGGTSPAKAIASASMGTEGKATFTVHSVWVDESKMGVIDRAILNAILLVFLRKIESVLSGITLIPPKIKVKDGEVALTKQDLIVGSNRFTLTAQLATGSGAKSIAQWPADPAVVLMTPAFLTAVANAGIVGTSIHDSGKSGLTAYQYTVTVKSATANSGNDGDPITMAIGLTMDASADIMGGICGASTATGAL